MSDKRDECWSLLKGLEFGLQVEREVDYDIMFHGKNIGRYRADMIVESKVVVEVKTGKGIHPTHEDQLRNYLHASNLSVGLLFNFGPKAQFKRQVWTPPNAKSAAECDDARRPTQWGKGFRA